MARNNRNRRGYRSDDYWDQYRDPEFRERDFPENYRQINYDPDYEQEMNRSRMRNYPDADSRDDYYENASRKNLNNEYEDRVNRVERSGYYDHDRNEQERRQEEWENNSRQHRRNRNLRDYDERNAGYRSHINRNYGDEQHGSMNRYGGDTANYGNANQGGFDRDWWDRTRDEVASWFGDDKAEKRRDRDRITDSYRGKGPRGYKRSSERIREDVCDRLTENPMIDASEMEVNLDGTEVILTGSVHSREEKRRAEDIAESVPGVSNVQNQLRVNHGRND